MSNPLIPHVVSISLLPGSYGCVLVIAFRRVLRDLFISVTAVTRLLGGAWRSPKPGRVYTVSYALRNKLCNVRFVMFNSRSLLFLNVVFSNRSFHANPKQQRRRKTIKICFKRVDNTLKGSPDLRWTYSYVGDRRINRSGVENYFECFRFHAKRTPKIGFKLTARRWRCMIFPRDIVRKITREKNTYFEMPTCVWNV